MVWISWIFYEILKTNYFSILLHHVMRKNNTFLSPQSIFTFFLAYAVSRSLGSSSDSSFPQNLMVLWPIISLQMACKRAWISLQTPQNGNVSTELAYRRPFSRPFLLGYDPDRPHSEIQKNLNPLRLPPISSLLYRRTGSYDQSPSSSSLKFSLFSFRSISENARNPPHPGRPMRQPDRG